MSIRMAARCTPRLLLIFAVVMALLPLGVAPAEAKRIKLRFHSSSSGSGSSSAFSPAEKRDENLQAGPRSPDTAAAAAARARAALAAETTARSSRPVARVYQPVPGGKTTSYPNGVTCIAGC